MLLDTIFHFWPGTGTKRHFFGTKVLKNSKNNGFSNAHFKFHRPKCFVTSSLSFVRQKPFCNFFSHWTNCKLFLNFYFHFWFPHLFSYFGRAKPDIVPNPGREGCGRGGGKVDVTHFLLQPFAPGTSGDWPTRLWHSAAACALFSRSSCGRSPPPRQFLMRDQR